MTTPLRFIKAHATENDFVVIVDVDDNLEITPEQVAFLCDRRAGIGGDGLLRVVRQPASAGGRWFMDYRNADGSIAEMCGNGIRAFAHVLLAEGLESAREFEVDTRAGVKTIRIVEFDPAQPSAAVVSVGMGEVTVTGVSTARMGDFEFAGIGVDVGNPHLACVIPRLTPQQLAKMEFTQPEFDTDFFPEGVNVEILTELTGGAVHMRVWERGVGETRSCGTGTVAAAQAALADAGVAEGTVTVNVAGGAITIDLASADSAAGASTIATMTGPSTIVAHGKLAKVLGGTS